MTASDMLKAQMVLPLVRRIREELGYQAKGNYKDGTITVYLPVVEVTTGARDFRAQVWSIETTLDALGDDVED